MFAISLNQSRRQLRDDAIPWRVKPLGELLFLLLVLRRYGVKHREMSKMTEYVLAEARTFDWHELAAYDASAATPLAMVADFFEVQGRSPPFDVGYFSTLVSARYFDGMDRLPYRCMDLAYSLGRVGHLGADLSLAARFNETAFGRNQLLARYSIDDLYSLTHAIFYLTDVGFVPLESRLSEATIARLRRDLVALTAIMVRGDNCDVLGELLLGWMFCRIRPHGVEKLIFHAGIDRMLAAATPTGAVPSSSACRDRALAGDASFVELYHTTLVFAMLASLMDRRQ